MKKYFIYVLALMFILTSGIALASGTDYDVSGKAKASIDFHADGDLVVDGGIVYIPFGKAFGGGLALGSEVDIEAAGFVRQGKIVLKGGGSVGAIVLYESGKAVAQTGVPGFDPDTKVSYVWTSTRAIGETSQFLHIGLYGFTGEYDDQDNPIFGPGGSGRGLATADFSNRGFTKEGTLNISFVSLPFFFQTDGDTSAFSGQYAKGGYKFDDHQFRIFCWNIDLPDAVVEIGGWRNGGEYAGAGFDIGIEVDGWSYSESGRFLSQNGGWRTEGLYSMGSAGTRVNSWGHVYDYDGYKSFAAIEDLEHAGWEAGGRVQLNAAQTFGGSAVIASAVGSYSANGVLNTGMTGDAAGRVVTSISILEGARGQIVRGSAEMSVSVTTNGNIPDAPK